MQSHESCDTEPVREDWRLLLFLAALSSLGLLMWAGLFLIIQWSLLTAWALAFTG
jgi:hypothetical protein